MKLPKLFLGVLLTSFSFAYAQVGIGTTNPNARLEIRSTNQVTPSSTDGILIPKADNFPASPPAASQDGMLLYLTGNGSPSKGFYYWDNALPNWVSVTNKSGWQETGNVGTTSSINFIGTTDSQDLTFRTNNIEKLRLTQKGQLEFLNTGSSTFIGNNAGENESLAIQHNTFVGAFSGEQTTVGGFNSFYGSQSGRNNVNGVFNSFFGFESGRDNTANSNSFFGYRSGNLNSTGGSNSYFGMQAGRINTSGGNNNFFGANSGGLNSVGSFNNFFGTNSGSNNINGQGNTAIGNNALNFNQSGNSNVALGSNAGFGLTGGNNNTFIGNESGGTVTRPLTGSVFIGNFSGYFESNNDRLYIENTSSSSPLIYGEFDNDILRVNGTLQINNPTTIGYSLPNIDGTVGQVLQTDGNGAITFVNAPDADTEWSKTGNSGTNSATNFIGTIDTQDLTFRTNNIEKLRLTQKGQLEFLNTGNSVFIGDGAGDNDNLSNNHNIAVGLNALQLNTSGFNNVAIGTSALNEISGNNNTGVGVSSLSGGINGSNNVAIGMSALSGSSGFSSDNVALGNFTQVFGSASNNVIVGNNSRISTGSNNVMLGYNSSATGSNNVILGNNILSVTNSNSIYIGNSLSGISFGPSVLAIDNLNSDPNTSLIYGEFDNDILRTNSTFQVGSPSGSIPGRISVYSGSVIYDVDINPQAGYVFNERALDADFRVEGNSVTHMLFVDANEDVVRFGRENSSLAGDGITLANGALLSYVADFERQNGGVGATVGIGNTEYIADIGSNLLAANGGFVPSQDNLWDLGLPNMRWDDVRATNGVIITSDMREKESVTEITYGLKEILQLRSIKFQWKNDYDRNYKIGLSAQQLQQVIPEVVKDYYYEHPEDGSAPIKKQADLLGVYYSDIIPVLVKAIQEQDEKIKSLEERLEALENN